MYTVFQQKTAVKLKHWQISADFNKILKMCCVVKFLLIYVCIFQCKIMSQLVIISSLLCRRQRFFSPDCNQRLTDSQWSFS